jgi:predicted nucleotidyltransferase/Zn-dependent peptidase ImmA (M78 family)/DNA-binding XRE family transcriptional regulator
MLFGERIKIARRRAELSQRALGDAAGVSAMAISKYERGLDVPRAAVLLGLAKALGVRTEYFLRPVTVNLPWPSYRRRAPLPRKKEWAIQGQVQEWLERYLVIESLLGEARTFRPPASLDRRVAWLGEVERVALRLRRAWALGLAPIESLAEVLEDEGMKVGLVGGQEDFAALTFWLNDESPVFALKRGLPGDRQRLSLAHELGHLLLEPAEGVDAEKAAYRFAGAFLVPAPAAYGELGQSRTTLHHSELHLLKKKYGLSMQAWVHRAKELGIISEASAARLRRTFRQQGWHQREPGSQIPPEKPGRMERLALRALAEGVISRSRAAELVGQEGKSIRGRIAVSQDEIADFCRRNQIRSLSLFGSVLRPDLTPESDVDLLVEFEPEAQVGFLALSRLRRELSELLGRPVDLVPREGLKPLVEESLLGEAELVYGA